MNNKDGEVVIEEIIGKTDLSSISVEKHSPLKNTSVGVSSLFDSYQQSPDEMEIINNGFSALDPSVRQIFYLILNKIDLMEKDMKLLYEQLQLEKKNNIKLKEELLTTKNDLQNKNSDLNDDLHEIFDELYKMDCKIIQNNQYTRRESLIISGIPDRITQRDLEDTVLEILRSIGLTTITSYNITACHRLKKK